jgi:hypothetical protein
MAEKRAFALDVVGQEYASTPTYRIPTCPQAYLAHPPGLIVPLGRERTRVSDLPASFLVRTGLLNGTGRRVRGPPVRGDQDTPQAGDLTSQAHGKTRRS